MKVDAPSVIVGAVAAAVVAWGIWIATRPTPSSSSSNGSVPAVVGFGIYRGVGYDMAPIAGGMFLGHVQVPNGNSTTSLQMGPAPTLAGLAVLIQGTIDALVDHTQIVATP